MSVVLPLCPLLNSHTHLAGAAPPGRSAASGLANFIPKFIEIQFSVSAANAALATGAAIIPGVAGGTQQQFTTASGRCTHQHAAAAIPLRR